MPNKKAKIPIYRLCSFDLCTVSGSASGVEGVKAEVFSEVLKSSVQWHFTSRRPSCMHISGHGSENNTEREGNS